MAETIPPAGAQHDSTTVTAHHEKGFMQVLLHVTHTVPAVMVADVLPVLESALSELLRERGWTISL
jgi:hypothetical protein